MFQQGIQVQVPGTLNQNQVPVIINHTVLVQPIIEVQAQEVRQELIVLLPLLVPKVAQAEVAQVTKAQVAVVLHQEPMRSAPTS